MPAVLDDLLRLGKVINECLFDLLLTLYELVEFTKLALDQLQIALLISILILNGCILILSSFCELLLISFERMDHPVLLQICSLLFWRVLLLVALVD